MEGLEFMIMDFRIEKLCKGYCQLPEQSVNGAYISLFIFCSCIFKGQRLPKVKKVHFLKRANIEKRLYATNRTMPFSLNPIVYSEGGGGGVVPHNQTICCHFEGP